MRRVNVVIVNADRNAAAAIASALNPHFGRVSVIGSREELRSAIARNRAHLAIVDLETITLEDVQQLCLEFAQTSVVCTHRVADEEMWVRALEAGAMDCCPSRDMHSIILAARNQEPLVHSNAA